MRKKLCFLMAIMLYCTTAMAQVTTSSMSGKVTMKDSGEEVIGATVLYPTWMADSASRVCVPVVLTR